MGRTPRKARRCYLLDFGLARKYRLPSGEIRLPRKTAGFRGTARYASINSHKSKELSRRDDLWSVFYVLVEFLHGQLPWRKLKDKDHIGQLKIKYTNAELVKDLPKEFQSFMEHLQKLDYADTPDYDYLRSILMQVYSREGYPSDAPFDWEATNNNNNNNNKDVNLEIPPHRLNSSGSLLADAPIMSNSAQHPSDSDLRAGSVTGSSSNRRQQHGSSMFQPQQGVSSGNNPRRRSLPNSPVGKRNGGENNADNQNGVVASGDQNDGEGNNSRRRRTTKCRCVIS